MTWAVNCGQGPCVIVVVGGEMDCDSKQIDFHNLTREDWLIPAHNNATWCPSRGGVNEFVETSGSKFFYKERIETCSLCFLDAVHNCHTFFYFFLNCFTFILFIYPSDIPIENVPGPIIIVSRHGHQQSVCDFINKSRDTSTGGMPHVSFATTWMACGGIIG